MYFPVFASHKFQGIRKSLRMKSVANLSKVSAMNGNIHSCQKIICTDIYTLSEDEAAFCICRGAMNFVQDISSKRR